MKLRLPLSLLAFVGALASPVLASADEAACNITFVGDSITQGGYWNGIAAPTYRWHFFKILKDQGVTYNPVGAVDYSANHHNSATQPNVSTLGLSYRGEAFDYTHEAAGASVTVTWAGLEANESLPGVTVYPQSRQDSDKGTVWNFLGLENPYTGCAADEFYYNDASTPATYTGNTADGAAIDKVCLLIGTNDLGNNLSADAAIANTKQIVEAFQTYNPNVEVTVIQLLPRAVAGNIQAGEIDAYNQQLSETMGSGQWSTESSTVKLVSVSDGLSVTSKASDGTAHFSSDALHPADQGQLLIAGNLAHAMGYGQRTLGLAGKAAAALEHQVNLSELQAHFSSSGTPAASLTPLSGSSAILLSSEAGSETSLTFGEEDGWNVTADGGYTLTTSIQMGDLAGNTLSLNFGDGTHGGTLTINDSGIYWADSNKLLYAGAQTEMTDYRIVYMEEENEQLVDAGYYVWRNNQLIGEALTPGSVTADSLSISSSASSLSYAALGGISWENSAYCSDITTIATTLDSVVLPNAVPSIPIVSPGNNGTNLNDAATWAAGSLPTASTMVRFEQGQGGTYTYNNGPVHALGIEVATNTTVRLTTNATRYIQLYEGGIKVEKGGHAYLQKVNINSDQEWRVEQFGTTLTIGDGQNANGSLATVNGSHTVTITGGGTDLLAGQKGNGGFTPTVNWVLTEGSFLRVLGNSFSGNVGALGNGSITLKDGGVLGVNNGAAVPGAVVTGNWHWSNDIIVGNQAANAYNRLHLYYEDADTYVVLSGQISQESSATDTRLVFAKSDGVALNELGGYVLAGDNSGYTGTFQINSGVNLRVGTAVSGSQGPTVNEGTHGTLNSGSVVNNGRIVFTRTDELTVSSAISGSGDVQVGHESLLGTAGQMIRLTGQNTYTGSTSVENGTLRVEDGAGISASSAYTVAQGAHLQLAGSGFISNSHVCIRARSAQNAKLRAAMAEGDLTGVVVGESSITAATGADSPFISNALIEITGADYTIDGVSVGNSSIVLAEGSEVLNLMNTTLDELSSVTGVSGSVPTVQVTNTNFKLGEALRAEGESGVFDLSSAFSGVNLAGSLMLSQNNVEIADYSHMVFLFNSNVNTSGLELSLLGTDGTMYALSRRDDGSWGSAAAVPEPSTASLGLLALSALALRRRRRA